MSYLLLRIFSEHGQDGVGCLLRYGPLGEVVADNGCLYYTLFLRGNCRSTQVSRLIDHHSDEVVIHGCQPLDFDTVTMEVCSRRRHVPPLPCPFVQGNLTVKHTVSGSRHTLLLGFSGPSGELMSMPRKVNGVIFRLQGPLYSSIPLRSCLFLGHLSNQV